MSPALQARALRPLEQAFLYCMGSMKVVAPPAPLERAPGGGRKVGGKNSVRQGRVREVAIAVVKGEITGENIPAIAAAEGVGSDSLKASIWRYRKEQEEAP